MALKVEGLSKHFGRVKALDNLSLNIPDKTLTCFLGPSGCGKTTLLRVIAGLEEADSGRIVLNSADLSKTHPSQRNFGVVFQSYSLFPNLSALKNVSYGLECRKWDKHKAHARALEMLDLVQLADQADKLPSQMSGGQQQRVAIARALAPEPSLLLLDEPLSALDANVRGELRAEIRKIQRDIGITTIMVTHDQSEALEMADQIVVLRNGKIEQTGSAQDLYYRPKSEFVANFIGTINLLPAKHGSNGILQYGSANLDTANNDARDTLFGLRPEAISLSQTPTKRDNTLLATVKNIRFMGNLQAVEIVPDCAPDQLLYVELHGQHTLPKVGDPIYLNFDRSDLRELRS